MRFVAARVVLLRGDVVPVPCGVWGAWRFRCVAVFRVGAVAPRLFGAGVARVFVSMWCALGCRRVVRDGGFVGWLRFCATVVVV